MLIRNHRAIFALAALAAAAVASADKDRHTFNIAKSSTDWAVDSETQEDNTKGFTLPRFDEKLGKLLGVSFHVDASLVSDVSVSNLSRESGNHLTNTVGGHFDLKENGMDKTFFSKDVANTWENDFAINTTPGTGKPQPIYDGLIGQKYTGVTASDFADYSTDCADILSYVSTADIDHDLGLSFTMFAYDHSHTTDTAHNFKGIYLTQAQASGWIEYDYAPQAVPEPASMAALGLGALGVLRRRSIKRGAR